MIILAIHQADSFIKAGNDDGAAGRGMNVEDGDGVDGLVEMQGGEASGVAGAGFGRTFPLLGPTVLGRAPECDIHLDHPGVSRQHLRLTPTDEGLLVEDLGSTNGWLLNETARDRAWARHGDELGVDALRFRVIAPGANGDRGARADGRGNRGASRWWWLAAVPVLLGVVALLLR